MAQSISQELLGDQQPPVEPPAAFPPVEEACGVLTAPDVLTGLVEGHRMGKYDAWCPVSLTWHGSGGGDCPHFTGGKPRQRTREGLGRVTQGGMECSLGAPHERPAGTRTR